MTVARKLIVDPDLTPLYHCISRCVRHASLCGGPNQHRKQWIEDRLEELSSIFAIESCGFAVLDNHLHVLVLLEPQRAKKWTDHQVVQRWAKLYPPRKKGKPLPVSKQWIAEKLSDPDWVQKIRKRLASLSWFMKCLKEPLAKMANKEDGCSGHFFEARFKSVAILDEESLLATCAYIDLNPYAAGLCSVPEQSPFTSIRARVEHYRKNNQLNLLRDPAAPGGGRAKSLEQSHWLCPIEDRHEQGGERAGMVPGFTLRSYLQLLDWTSRLCRSGKARVGPDVPAILQRLGSDTERWESKLRYLFERPKLIGSFFGNMASLQRVASSLGQQWVKNLAGRPA
jgi:hypothetical protein